MKAVQKEVSMVPFLDGEGLRILIVDDQSSNRMVLTHLLEETGCELKEAVDGQQGCDICFEWRPHLVLMDIAMPVLDGYLATRKIREEAEIQPAILILTAHAIDTDLQKILAAGADGFLTKPFKIGELSEKIKETLAL
jgi:CheY-like chemotaxis protein